MDDTAPPESAPIKRSFIDNEDSEIKYQTKDSKESSKGVLLIIGLLVILSLGGFFLNQKFHLLLGSGREIPKVSPTPEPTPSPSLEPVLNRAEWSFEILNGTSVSGAAKKLADKIKALGYSVVKVSNADKDNYTKTQIEVKKKLSDQVDLLIVDLKDTVKVASVAGELKEGTASARIIIGKDSI